MRAENGQFAPDNFMIEQQQVKISILMKYTVQIFRVSNIFMHHKKSRKIIYSDARVIPLRNNKIVPLKCTSRKRGVRPLLPEGNNA
jgi:hypothetical protein